MDLVSKIKVEFFNALLNLLIRHPSFICVAGIYVVSQHHCSISESLDSAYCLA